MGSITFFGRHKEVLETIYKEIKKRKATSFASIGCSIGCDLFDLIVHLRSKEIDVNQFVFDGYDSNKDLIKHLESEPYLVSISKNVTDFELWEQKIPYPFPVLTEETFFKYRHLFNDRLVMLEEVRQKISFNLLDIVTQDLCKNYDVILSFHCLNHVFEKMEEIEKHKILNKLMNRASHLLVILAYPKLESLWCTLHDYLSKNNCSYSKNGEYFFIFTELTRNYNDKH